MPTLYLEQTLANQITATLPFIFRTIRGGFRGINLMTRVNVASLSVYEVRIYSWTANLSTALYLCEHTRTWRERSDRLSQYSRTGTRKLHYQTFPGSQLTVSDIFWDSRHFKLRHIFLSFRLFWFAVTNDTTRRHFLRKLRSTVWGTKQ